ncbi:hypothetical protein [Streptomyces sp. OE57]|uniref:hypothetical protein n=1 Tax=Streptomyces lacaronensis TaxID=3379885 RepID=UPI0039B746B0
MIVALTLVGYATALAAMGGRVLRLGGWTDRAPRLGITLWWRWASPRLPQR